MVLQQKKKKRPRGEKGSLLKFGQKGGGGENSLPPLWSAAVSWSKEEEAIQKIKNDANDERPILK